MSEKNILSQEELDALLNVSNDTIICSQQWVDVSIELMGIRMPLNKIHELINNKTLDLEICLEDVINVMVDGKILAKGKIKVRKNKKFFLELIK